MSPNPVPAGVRIERPADHVAEVVMDRPGARNALSTDQARALALACDRVGEDRGVRVVLLTSAVDGTFCVGADLKERHGMTTAQLLAQRPVLRAAFASVLGLAVPVVAVVDGWALGGGYELALGCDVIVASTRAVVGLPEVGLGLVPGGGGTQLLTRRLGYPAAALAVLTGRRYEAAEAHRLGMVDVLAEPADVRARALALAAELAANSPTAVRHAKIAMRHGRDQPLSEGLLVEDRAWESAARSADRVEGIAAFVEKRPPRWADPR